MSLYNDIFQENKDANILLGVLGLNKGAFGRYRDIYLNKAGDKIIVFTRCGGSNRKDYPEVFREMHKHPNYIRDYDDDFDKTYAYIEFSIPDKYKDMCKKIAPEEEPLNVSEKFDKEIEAMTKNPNGPEAKRAMAIFGPIFEEIEKDMNNNDKNKRGGMTIIGL